MFKTIIEGPTPECRYRKRMGFRGLNVVNGPRFTGRLPTVVGSGIFGEDDQESGIFDGIAGPQSRPTGIFFDDTSRYSYELAQPDLNWTLLRRPGVPLYPGSSSYGIVLTGPSMGSNGNAEASSSGSPPVARWVAAAVLGTLLGLGLSWMTGVYPFAKY